MYIKSKTNNLYLFGCPAAWYDATARSWVTFTSTDLFWYFFCTRDLLSAVVHGPTVKIRTFQNQFIPKPYFFPSVENFTWILQNGACLWWRLWYSYGTFFQQQYCFGIKVDSCRRAMIYNSTGQYNPEENMFLFESEPLKVFPFMPSQKVSPCYWYLWCAY